jgi:hypothetical protein
MKKTIQVRVRGTKTTSGWTDLYRAKKSYIVRVVYKNEYDARHAFQALNHDNPIFEYRLVEK